MTPSDPFVVQRDQASPAPRQMLADGDRTGGIACFGEVTHLVGLVGADVRVKIEITAEVGDGIPESVVRTVTENAATLKFEQHGFEES